MQLLDLGAGERLRLDHHDQLLRRLCLLGHKDSFLLKAHLELTDVVLRLDELLQPNLELA